MILILLLNYEKMINVKHERENNIEENLIEFFSTTLSSNETMFWVPENDDGIISNRGICFFRVTPSLSNPSGKFAYITNVFTLN